MIAIDPARIQRLESQRTLAVLIACVMTVVAVVAIAAPPIAAQQREVRERSAELSIPARPVAAINP